jgi:Lrp/AsnC family leucine-responsive transcriptional regulator
MTDETDGAIVDLLRRDGRASIADIATKVSLSPAAVSRRLARLESTGVIRGYVAIIDDNRIGGLEAFVEIRLNGVIDSDQGDELARDIPEITDFYNVAGDPDLIVKLRVRDREELSRVVNSLRRTGKIAGTKTLIVLDSWSRS